MCIICYCIQPLGEGGAEHCVVSISGFNNAAESRRHCLLRLHPPRGRAEGKKLHPRHAEPLIQRHKHGEGEIVHLLLHHGVDAGAKFIDGWTPLHHVAQRGDWGGLSCPASLWPRGECRSKSPSNNPASPPNFLHPQPPVGNTFAFLVTLGVGATDARAYTSGPRHA